MIQTHRTTVMRGRDPGEPARAATPLELFYDLTFVVAFSVAGTEFSHYAAEGYVGAAVIAFLFCLFGVCWAWINFTWFASAYDTDDWPYRLAVMVQMIGVVILSLGIPAVFDSVVEGDRFDNRALVFGYVVIRVPLLLQWLRASVQDPQRRSLCLTYFVGVTIAQIGWIALAIVDLPLNATVIASIPMVAVEIAVPFIAERRDGGTPWHPHHVSERYGLMTIIVLGEILLGVVASLSVVITDSGWTFDVALVAVGGVGLMFGMWWLYFMYPAGELLHNRRDLGFRYGLGHIPLWGAIALVGAGLHIGALWVENHAELTKVEVMWTIVVPLLVFFVTLSYVFGPMIKRQRLNLAITLVKAAIVLLAVLWAAAGLSLAWCLMWLSLAPIASVIINEIRAEVPGAELSSIS